MPLPTDSIKISQLPSLSTPTATDQLPVVSGGVTQKETPSQLSTDWKSLPILPNSVTALGNRLFQIVFPAVDYTGIAGPGMRMRETRTVASPIQCANLNGTTQYFNRSTTINGMTFTDDFAGGGYVKLAGYPSNQATVISRLNSANGWALVFSITGQLSLVGNSGSGNYRAVTSIQSIPLGKWVHVAAQLDMSAFTLSPTTCYVMFDGIDIPSSLGQAGTNPASLVQAGNLEIGTQNGGLQPLNGKLAQIFISSAKITQPNIRTIYAQGITPAVIAANNIISAYSLSNSVNDLNTTNANNLTAQGSATTTTFDAPYGIQADGTNSTTVDFGIILKSSFATDTTMIVQAPEGGTIPTSGGIAAVAYSTVSKPIGFPGQAGKWRIESLSRVINQASGTAVLTWYNPGTISLNVPIGEWILSYSAAAQINTTNATNLFTALSTSTTAASHDKLVGQAIELGSNVNASSATVNRQDDVSLVSSTVFYLLIRSLNSGGSFYFRGDNSVVIISAQNAYL